MALFATIAEITTLTGATVDAATRGLAAQTIETNTGLIEGTLDARTDISDRDLYWLKLACAWQAAWLQAQPDFLTRNDVSAASADGQSATGRADWLTLSPMARSSIKRLAWVGTRAIMVGPNAARFVADPLGEESDDREKWRPIA